jgi:hypothetical protein
VLSTPLVPTGSNGITSMKVSGSEGFSCIIDFDQSSHLPVAIHYKARIRIPPATPVIPARSGQGAPPSPEDVDVKMRFEERSKIEGLLVPTRVITEAHGIVLEDMKFERIVINSNVSAAEFKISN